MALLSDRASLPTGGPSGHQQAASGPEAPSISTQPVPSASAGLPAESASPPAAAAPHPAAAGCGAPAAAAAVASQRPAAAPPTEPTQHVQPAHAALFNGRLPGRTAADG